MCGIAGIIDFTGSSHRLDAVQRMCEAMVHRGPDDAGIVTFAKGDRPPHHVGLPDAASPVIPPALQGESVARLGHRRLAILDLTAEGHQPMCTEDGRFWIVHNGEVYNFKELRAELQSLGDAFHSRTDTEVILKAYRRWGPDCLQRFNGMWAFAIWDDRRKELFCARDRIGIKPFHYLRTSDFFLFASDVKTIIASGLYSPAPDLEGLYHSMSLYAAPRPLTCFRDVRGLAQAHRMTVGLDGTVDVQRYWSLPRMEPSTSSDADWIARLDDLLNKSVRLRLVSDVPVGTFMSGGIDSSTVSAVASRWHPEVKAFTLAFPGEGDRFNEVPEAEATARMNNMKHIVRYQDVDTIIDHLEDIVRCNEEPYYSLPPTGLVSELARDNDITVVLGGLGGDELFCGYRYHKTAVMWHRTAPWQRKLAGRLPPISGFRRLRKLSEMRNLFDCYLSDFGTFSEPDKRRLFHSRDVDGLDTRDVLSTASGEDPESFHDPIEAESHLNILFYLGNHGVYRNDQFTMYHTLECRLPMLDHEIVELACRMPSHMKLRDETKKYVLREVAKNYVSPECLAARKKGFSLPIRQWMRGKRAPFVREKLMALKERGIFRPETIDEYYSRWENENRSPTRVWYLVSVELWFEQVLRA